MDKISKRIKVEILDYNSKMLNDQRKEGKFCDLILRSKDNIQIKVHKSVMSGAGDFFNHLLTSGMKETSTGLVKLEHITGDILEKIVSFVYLGELKPDSPEEVQEIMKHACYFRLTKLIDLCCFFLKKCINGVNCVKYWRFARDYSSEGFADSCVNYILTFDGGQLFSSLLTNFTVEEMQTLLESDRLPGTEEEIFQDVLKWAKCRTAADNRKDFLDVFCKVVDFIRFPLMMNEFLLYKVLSNQDLAKDQALVTKISECAQYTNKSEGPFLFPKWTTPRIGSRMLELVALYDSGVLKITDKGIPQILENKRDVTYVNYGYTTFGSNFLLTCGGANYKSVSLDDAQYFSPITRKFYPFPKMSKKISGISCVAIDNKIYACGTTENTIVFELERGQWCDGSRMNKGLWEFGLTSVGNSLYAIHCDEDFTVEMLDPRDNVGWTNIFEKLNHITKHCYGKCVSIENNIYCFTSERQFIFDLRMNKLRHWGCDVDIFQRKKCKFNVCEINSEIGIFAAVDNRFHFFKCDTDGEVTFKAYSDGITCNYPVIVSMYC